MCVRPQLVTCGLKASEVYVGLRGVKASLKSRAGEAVGVV